MSLFLLDYINRRAVQTLFSNADLLTINPVFGETLPLSVALVDFINQPQGQQIWTPRDLTSWTIRAAIGLPFQQPAAGTFTLTYEASDTSTQTTAPIVFNPLASDVASALNALSKVVSAGGVTVTGSAGYFFVTFNTPSVQFQITGDPSDLAPLSIIETGILIAGQVSPARNCVQTIRILQNPGAYASLTVANDAPAVNVTVNATGGSGVNANVSVAFNQYAYGGFWTLSLSGMTTPLLSSNIAPQPVAGSSAPDLQTILENLSHTSGLLVTGRKYKIVTFVASDDFSNIGASNVTGNVFVATGTTPTNWAHGSTVSAIGAGNVSVNQNADGSYVIGFQGEMANTAMGTISGSGAALEVVPTLSGTLSLNTTGMELLLGGAQSVSCIFEIEGTPPGGNPLKLYRAAVTVFAAIIDPADLVPTPRATFYTSAEVDALLATYQPLDATLTTLSGKATSGTGDIVLATNPTITGTSTDTAIGDVTSAIGGAAFPSSAGNAVISGGKISAIGMTLTLTGHATGDIYYDAGSGVIARLPKGSDGDTMKMSAGLPSWVTLPPVSGPLVTVVSSGNPTAQNATNNSVATYTTPNDSTVHSFRVGAYTAITAISAGTLTATVVFTDENGTSQTITYFPMGLTSAGLTTTGFTGFAPVNIRCNPNTAITVKTTFTGVSITYDAGGTIESLY